MFEGHFFQQPAERPESTTEQPAVRSAVGRAYLKGGVAMGASQQRVLVHLCAEAFPGDNEE